MDDFYEKHNVTPFSDSLKNIENYKPEKSETKKDKDISALEIIEVAADVLTLVPGVDTFANAVSLVINVIQGDWDEAALSAVGMVPILGEFADAAKTGKLAVKVIDKVHDASKVAKFFDKTLTAMKNPKFLKKAGKFGEAIVDGIISGSVYSSDGKSFGKGFANGFVSTYISNTIQSINDDIPSLAIVGDSIGSALGSFLESFISGDNIERTADNVIKSALTGLASGSGSAFIKNATKLANEANSVARELMKYDEKFGKALEFFFDRLFTALTSM